MGLVSRIKNWATGETVTNTDLNAEFDNVLDNLTAANIDDYSTNQTEMQTVTDPGEVGTESLATSAAGELARLRFAVKEIKGDVAQWYTTGSTSLSEVSAALGSALDGNRISSGLIRTTSSQPVFLVPNGAAATLKVDGDTTNLIYYVNGTQATVATEVAVTSISLAPSSNNTALVNDPSAADGEATKLLGEYGSIINIDAAGTEIVSKVGDLTAFSINNGSATEYFIAQVKSATELIEVRRGYFFDSSSVPIPRIVFSDNDTITLMRLSWIFGKSDATIVKSANSPKWTTDEPTSPNTDDYWFDMVNNTWKKYDGATFVSADATLLGIAIADATNCIGARSLEFAGVAIPLNGISLEKVNATTVRAVLNRPVLGVYNQKVKYEYDAPEWDIATDLESGVTEASATMYYLYISETGNEYISDKIPYDREADLGGYYHPHQIWRCVGQVYNDGSSDFEEAQTFDGIKSIFPSEDNSVITVNSSHSVYAIPEVADVILIDALSDAVTLTLPPVNQRKGRKLAFKRIDNTDIEVITFVDGDVTVGSDTINIASHSYEDLQRVQLTTTTTLPAGLALATDYYVIYVDANNVKLASSRVLAIADTAVDITAAASGGTHTITNQLSVVNIDGDGAETIDGATGRTLESQYHEIELICDGNEWFVLRFNPNSESIVSMVRVNSANGYGSTATKIRRFNTVVTNTGDSITYADSAANGASFTINVAGVYSITSTDAQASSNRAAGISLNSTQLTTSISSITAADMLAYDYQTINGGANQSNWTGVLAAKDVVRSHNEGLAAGISTLTITRIK